MAEMQMKFNEYFRAATTGVKFEEHDPRNVGGWRLDRGEAVGDAGPLITVHGTGKNVSVQARVMLEEHADCMNRKRQQMHDTLNASVHPTEPAVVTRDVF